MRIDLFLKLMGVTKTRMGAKRLCDSGKVHAKATPLKPSQEILTGDVLQVSLPQRVLRLQILDIPSGKSVAKADRSRFVSVEILRED
ncbi:MAG TPA: RNA-binding S4 domain-containing protein [bacterium]|nr:RNA-binding S4 domain-containing protein [bacterium]